MRVPPTCGAESCRCNLCTESWEDVKKSVSREPFQEKMDDWEQCAPAALREIIEWLQSEPETLLAIARGRVAWGHYRHGDTLMYEFNQAQLVANASEEIADCINYLARLVHLRDNAEQPLKFSDLEEMVAS